MYQNGDICPICGCDGIEKKEITETFVYKGHTLKIKNYIIYECPGCGESIVDNATLKKSEKISFHPNNNTASLIIRFNEFIKYLDSVGNTYEFLDLESQ